MVVSCNLIYNLYRLVMRSKATQRKSQLRIFKTLAQMRLVSITPLHILLSPWTSEGFRSLSISGHCQIILKKRMLRTKKPNQEKIKVKIKSSDHAKPLNITFPLTSMQIILRYIFLILFIPFKRERPHQGKQCRVVRMHNVMTVCRSHYRRQQELCQVVWWGRVADFYAESADIFQVWTTFTERKIENAGPEPTLKIHFS